jgi:hypothetical protein
MGVIGGALLITLREPLVYFMLPSLFGAPREYTMRYQAFSAVLGASMLIGGSGHLIMTYLSGRLAPDRSDASDLLRLRIQEETEASLEELRQASKEIIGRAELSAETRSEVIGRADTYIKTLLKDEAINAIEAKYASSIVGESKRRSITTIFAESRQRLKSEIASLGRRGNINLTLGFISTTIALGVLGYISFQFTLSKSPADQVNWPALASSYLPRLTLAIFIQTFAFFFLRLYRSALEEIKYFQNELTNLDCYAVAIELGADKECNQHAVDASAALLKIDRNHAPLPKQQIKKTSATAGDTVQSEMLSIARQLIEKVK